VAWWRRPPSTWAGRKEIAARPAPRDHPARSAKRATGENRALPGHLALRDRLGLLASPAHGAQQAPPVPLASLARAGLAVSGERKGRPERAANRVPAVRKETWERAEQQARAAREGRGAREGRAAYRDQLGRKARPVPQVLRALQARRDRKARLAGSPARPGSPPGS
jgi:hypothetical protein